MAPRFRVGSPERGLSDYLQKQGLTVERKSVAGASETPIFGQARVHFGGPLCRRVVMVDWRGDRQGIIRELIAQHSDTGCL